MFLSCKWALKFLSKSWLLLSDFTHLSRLLGYVLFENCKLSQVSLLSWISDGEVRHIFYVIVKKTPQYILGHLLRKIALIFALK